jgi:hypothetical protein
MKNSKRVTNLRVRLEFYYLVRMRGRVAKRNKQEKKEAHSKDEWTSSRPSGFAAGAM